jgi:hyperosmotically inducible protein
MVKKLATAALVLALTTGTAFAGQVERKDRQIYNDISKQVNRYTRFTVFDDVNVAIGEGGVVTLTGSVTMPYKRNDIANRVAKVDGVSQVNNQIQVLPVSMFDEELRYRIARAIYGNPSFWQYASRANPPIHIIVDRGRVTLTGVVNNNVERQLARSLATSFGAFSIKNELKTDAEVQAELEHMD